MAIESEPVDRAAAKSSFTTEEATECYVCIVDDDPDIRDTLAFVLGAVGFSTIQVPGGKEAIELLRKERRRCCLILLDLMMPMMSGWEFRGIQRADPELADIPVVVLSGVRDVADAGALAASGYLRKPVDLDVLVETVRSFCAKGPDEASGHKAKGGRQAGLA
ncbi:MAG: response regulator [Polyangiaceae bacterium]|nr:response regulator [Polyangiaceae bacterium]